MVCRVVEEWEGHPFEEREIPPLLAVVVVLDVVFLVSILFLPVRASKLSTDFVVVKLAIVADP